MAVRLQLGRFVDKFDRWSAALSTACRPEKATLLAKAKVMHRLVTRKPVFVGFNVTNRCNLRCAFCSVPHLPNPDMTLPQVEHALDRIAELGVPVVGITGGEPFLRKDLARILAAVDDRGMTSTLVTNGVALTRERVTELSNLKGLLQFALSVDSLDRNVYARLRGSSALPRTLANFLELRRYGPSNTAYKLNVVLTPENAPEVEAMVDFAASSRLFITFIPINIGPGGLHRGQSHATVTDEARQRMADAFMRLKVLKGDGAPLWDHRDFYDYAIKYLLGRSMGPCFAGELFLDLRSDGGLAFCNEMEHFISLLEVDRISLKEINQYRKEWQSRIDGCSSGQACCYTCSYNIVATAKNLPAYLFDYLSLQRKG